MENVFRFRDLIALLSTIKGDLSNTISPPSLLAPKSMTEIPVCWVERPSLFAAPALEPDPAKRALLVLQWLIGSLKAQFYIGEDSKKGIKKPLNAFLGEILIGSCTDEDATARLVVEQVSHHPPVTACYVWDEKHGIQCEGFSRVRMTFTGNINISQKGRSTVHIDKYNEDYHIPLIDAKVTGFFSGYLYPELFGTHKIVSSSGWISEIVFSGKGYLSGEKNHFSAKVYHKDMKSQTPAYTLCGQWCDKYKLSNNTNGHVAETCSVDGEPLRPLDSRPEADQDPWETRVAWMKVRDALKKGNLQKVVQEKSKIENAQRAMRKREAQNGDAWTPVFFSKSSRPGTDTAESEVGKSPNSRKQEEVWIAKKHLVKKPIRPFHSGAVPS